jgi:hypothetical protein
MFQCDSRCANGYSPRDSTLTQGISNSSISNATITKAPVSGGGTTSSSAVTAGIISGILGAALLVSFLVILYMIKKSKGLDKDPAILETERETTVMTNTMANGAASDGFGGRLMYETPRKERQ